MFQVDLIITILREFQDTPFPFLLAVSGLLFLVIAMVGHVGQMQISGVRQFWFGFTGIIFYILSIVSFTIPAFSSLPHHSFTYTIAGLQGTLIPVILFSGVIIFLLIGFGGHHGEHMLNGTRQAWSIITAIILIFALLFLFGYPTFSTVNDETLVVNFNSGTKGIQTQRVYQENVLITVSGVGQADGTRWSDAFYVFTDSQGIQAKPIHFTTLYNWALWINNQPADAFLAQSIPHYSANHVYKFTINAPVGHLVFAVGDKSPSKASGSYTIIVSPNS